MNRNLVTRLCPSILQNVTGRRPAAQITAPDREGRILTMLSERERLAQFRRSAMTVAGSVYHGDLPDDSELKV